MNQDLFASVQGFTPFTAPSTSGGIGPNATDNRGRGIYPSIPSNITSWATGVPGLQGGASAGVDPNILAAIAGQRDLDMKLLSEDIRRWEADFGLQAGSLGESARQFDAVFGRSAFESDRDFSESTRQFDLGFGLEKDMFGRSIFESDRDFGEAVRQFEISQDMAEEEMRQARALALNQLNQEQARLRQNQGEIALNAFNENVGRAAVPGVMNWNPFTTETNMRAPDAPVFNIRPGEIAGPMPPTPSLPVPFFDAGK